MKKVLIVTDVDFWEKSSGHRMRISALVTYLAQHVQLTVVNTGPAPADIEKVLGNTFKAEFFVLEKTKYLNSNGYGRRLKAFLKDKKFDAIIIEYIHCSYFLNFIIDGTKIILDAHDLMSERYEEFKKYNYADNLYEISRETEIEIFNAYDFVMVLCEPDYKTVSTMTNSDKTLLCPHPVIPCPQPIRNEVKNISFVASSYFPNSDAIIFFIKNCWPQISEKYQVNLTIYGTICNDLRLLNNERILLKGFVNDQNHIYSDSDIIINPVRFGAGLKIKNLEALSHGLPLVTTRHGARGIEAGINNCFLVADCAEEFIQSLESLINNLQLRIKLGKNANSFIKNNFSCKKCFEPLLTVINN